MGVRTEAVVESMIPTEAVRKAFVRRRRWVWVGLSVLAGVIVGGFALGARVLMDWERNGVETVAPIASVGNCRTRSEDEPVCTFRIVFRTADGRVMRASLVRNTRSATYADETQLSLLIRYGPDDPARVSTDFTDPTLLVALTAGALPFLAFSLLRISSGRRWLRRLDRLILDQDVPRNQMKAVLLAASGGIKALRGPWAWIVNPQSAATRGLNLPLIRGQNVSAPLSGSEVTVIGDPRAYGVVFLVVGGVPLYPSGRARRYRYSRRVQWEPVAKTF